jgi:hypothetical protein
MTQNISTVSPMTNNILCSIPITVNPFTMISYQNNTNRINLNSNVLNSIFINITDQDGKSIDLNGIHWSISLYLEIVNYAI